MLDQGERLTRLYHVISLDSSYLVNAQGVIVYAALAPLTAAAWDNRLQPLVSAGRNRVIVRRWVPRFVGKG